MTAIESVFFVQFKIHGFIIFDYIEDKDNKKIYIRIVYFQKGI